MAERMQVTIFTVVILFLMSLFAGGVLLAEEEGGRREFNETIFFELIPSADWRRGLRDLEGDFAVQWDILRQHLEIRLNRQEYAIAGLMAITVAKLAQARDPKLLDDLIDLFDPAILQRQRAGYKVPLASKIPHLVVANGLLRRIRDPGESGVWSPSQVAMLLLQDDDPVGQMARRYALIALDEELAREVSENYVLYRTPWYLYMVSIIVEKELVEREVLANMLRSALVLGDVIPLRARSVYFTHIDYSDDLALKLFADELQDNNAQPGMFRFLSSELRLKDMIERHGPLPPNWRVVLRPFAHNSKLFSDLVSSDEDVGDNHKTE